MSFETGTNGSVSFWSGPPSPKRKTPIQIAIQLSMIVEITSCAPTVALRKPAIPAQTAPTRAPATMAARTCTKPGSPGSSEPIQTAMIAPARYWPWPPMLNMPQRNANPTARPVSTSGTKLISVCCRLKAAVDVVDVPREPDVRVGERDADLVAADLDEPVEARALEDRLVGAERVVSGRREDDGAADQEREHDRQERDDDPAGLLGHGVASAHPLAVRRLCRPEARRRPERGRRRDRSSATALRPPPIIAIRAPPRRRSAGTRPRSRPRT